MRIFLLSLIWLALTIAGLSRLSFDVDIASLLPPDLPEAQGIRKLYDHFSREDELIAVLTAADAEIARNAAESLGNRLGEKTDLAAGVVWHLPFEENPELAADLLAWLWLNGSPEALAELESRISPEEIGATLEAALEDLASGFLDESTLLRSYDPLGFTDLPGGLRASAGIADDDRLFASEDGKTRLIYLRAPKADFAGYRETASWISEVRAEINAWREAESITSENVEIAFTGEPAFVAEISTAMERDMKTSAIATTLLIALLFWLWYRRLRPLLWLMLMLGLIFSGTFAVGGLVFGELTAMSIGFAAILLGLAVDYGVVLFRERNEAPGDPSALRRRIGPSILWAAATTATVFATLNLASLPGIAELGSLVAIGTVIGAGVMLGLFAPVAATDAKAHPAEKSGVTETTRSVSPLPAYAFTAILTIAGLGTLLTLGLPGLKRDAKPFQLRESESYEALEKMESALSGHADAALPPSLPVVVSGVSWEELHGRIAAAETRLSEAQDSGNVRQFLLPSTLIPQPTNQAANRERVSAITAQTDRLTEAILGVGFSDEATALTRSVSEAWTRLSQSEPLSAGDETWVLPESDLGRWLLGRAISHTETGAFAAAGTLDPANLETDAAGRLAWLDPINGDGIQVTGWDVLNPALQSLVAQDFRRVFLPMGLILTAMLALVFRDWRDLLIALGTLGFSGLILATLSRWVPGIEWNTFNMAALPILFGTGLDYAIHMIFALRRSRGELAPVRCGISQALLFCGSSTAIGFGSLAFAASEGLSSLGLVCGLGILLNMVAAIWLLPHWWRGLHRKSIAA